MFLFPSLPLRPLIEILPRKLKNHELNRLSVEKFRKITKAPIILLLDNVRSMHNVGSIFRTADAFKVEKIFLSGITATPPHRDIRKTALGAEESVAWEYVDDAKKALEIYKNEHIIALEQTTGSKGLRSLEWPKDKRLILIVGNEIDGVQDELIDLCTECIEIPQFGTKHSFNVSVSTGIALWECFNIWSER